MKNDEKTVFVEYFGDSPLIRVMDFFIENSLFDYNKTHISRETGIARSTLQEIIRELIDKNILVRTRTVGRSEMYKLNRGNLIVEELIKFAVTIVTAVVEHDVAKVKS